MADKQKSLGKTVLSWFVVRDEDVAVPAAAPTSPAGNPGEAAIDDLIARYAGDGAARPARPESKAPPPLPPDARATVIAPPGAASSGTAPPLAPTLVDGALPEGGLPPANLDLPALYRAYGIGQEEQSRVDRALSLLHTLPRETPKETKRQIVEAALLAFGIKVDAILEAAILHQRALDQHAEDGAQKTQTLLEESTLRLQELEREAERVRKIMQDQQIAQQALHLACADTRQKVQEILDFFGQEAVERVAQSSARLSVA